MGFYGWGIGGLNLGLHPGGWMQVVMLAK